MSPVRARSPARSRSPIRRRSSRSLSPVRGWRRRSSRSLSPVRGGRRRPSRSLSPVRGGRRRPSRSLSPVRASRRRSTRSKSPSSRKSPYRRTSPVPPRTAARTRSPGGSKVHVHVKSPVQSRSPIQARSPVRARSLKRAISPKSPSRSPSPRAKRMRQTREGKEFDGVKDRVHDGRSIEDHDRGRHRDKDKGSSRDGTREDKGSSRDGTREARGRDKYLDTSSMSPNDHRQRRKHGSRSPPHRSNEREPDKPKTANAGAYDEVPNQSAEEMPGSENPSHDSLAKMKAAEEALQVKQNDKVKPSFELSGKLAAETNKVRGVALLFNEPPDARKPTIRWRLYVFKGGEALTEPLYIHRQSCYLFGRERRVADVPTDHPSCSKQHAVIQFRQVEKDEPDGRVSKKVRPYLMDLGSTNGTHLNDNRLEPQRYYELFEKDTIKFGNSSREYVLLHENSAG